MDVLGILRIGFLYGVWPRKQIGVRLETENWIRNREMEDNPVITLLVLWLYYAVQIIQVSEIVQNTDY